MTKMYASPMRRFFVLCVFIAGAIVARAESPGYLVFVSNERSADVTVIDGATDAVITTFPVGKRPRGIHATPDGKRLFVTLSGSPRLAPGVDENRAPADKRVDGLVVIDAAAHKLIDRWHVGSDPEQFALSKDGKFAFIANEDDASASIVDLDSGQSRGKVQVSEEPEGVGVNPSNGEVYVTCEEKGEVFALDPSGSKPYTANGASNDVSIIDLKSRKELNRIKVGDGPWGIAIVGAAK